MNFVSIHVTLLSLIASIAFGQYSTSSTSFATANNVLDNTYLRSQKRHLNQDVITACPAGTMAEPGSGNMDSQIVCVQLLDPSTITTTTSALTTTSTNPNTRALATSSSTRDTTETPTTPSTTTSTTKTDVPTTATTSTEAPYTTSSASTTEALTTKSTTTTIATVALSNTGGTRTRTTADAATITSTTTEAPGIISYYKLMQKGSLTCNEGSKIVSEEDCITAASEMGGVFDSAFILPRVPQGCFRFKEQYYYWNSAVQGSENMDSQILCEIDPNLTIATRTTISATTDITTAQSTLYDDDDSVNDDDIILAINPGSKDAIISDHKDKNWKTNGVMLILFIIVALLVVVTVIVSQLVSL